MLQTNKKTFLYSFFTSLIFIFGLFLSAHGQASNLSSVRLTVNPSSVKQGDNVTFSVTGAQPNQQICIDDAGSVNCLNGVTNSSGSISETVQITGSVGTHTFKVRVGGSTGPVAPSATASLRVSSIMYANYNECAIANAGNMNVNCCEVGTVPSTDACFSQLLTPPDPTITPYTGGNTGVPSYVGNVSTPGFCENDPNLVWDDASKSCLPKNLQCTDDSLACSKSLEDLAVKLLTYLLYFAGIIAVIIIVWGGYLYITSAGNEEQAEKGQKAMTNAVIGVVLVIMALVIVRLISTTVITGNLGQ